MSVPVAPAVVFAVVVLEAIFVLAVVVVGRVVSLRVSAAFENALVSRHGLWLGLGPGFCLGLGRGL